MPYHVVPRFISFDTIVTNLYTAINKSGIQTRVALTETKGNGRERKEVQRANGFRKFAITKMAEAGIDYEIRERLVGHTIGMPGHYLRFGEQKYLEEYLKAVNLLTINEESRLRIKVQTMEADHSKEWNSIARKIEELDKKFGSKATT